MQYGIQRKGVFLVPPEPGDLDYVFEAFREVEIAEMFGFEARAEEEMRARHRKGTLVVGIIRRVVDRRRIGFAVCFPPPQFFEQWEYGIVILDPKDRDAFSAIAASDAIAHYMFDHLGVETGLWRIRADNRPSIAIARRMGYRPCGVWSVGDHRFNFYRITPDVWEKRLARLGPRETAFLTLISAPYEPELTSSAPTAEVERPA